LPADAAPSEAYGADYFDGSGPGGVDYEGSKPQFQLINNKRLDSILAQATGSEPRKALELGCALGFFMECEEARGWEAWGVELSPFAAAKAQARFGARVLQGTLDQAPADWRGFGLATAFHVMEHVPDARGVLADLSGRLVPGALLAFEVPDFGSRKAQAERERWKYFLPGEHLNYFTQAGLRALLESQGFEVLRFEATSFTRLLGPLDQAGLKGLKQVVLRFLPWLRWVKSLVLALRGLAGGHDCVLVIARKKAAA
jgi:SAM-dependent methyltransferase